MREREGNEDNSCSRQSERNKRRLDAERRQIQLKRTERKSVFDG